MSEFKIGWFARKALNEGARCCYRMLLAREKRTVLVEFGDGFVMLYARGERVADLRALLALKALPEAKPVVPGSVAAGLELSNPAWLEFACDCGDVLLADAPRADCAACGSNEERTVRNRGAGFGGSELSRGEQRWLEYSARAALRLLNRNEKRELTVEFPDEREPMLLFYAEGDRGRTLRQAAYAAGLLDN